MNELLKETIVFRPNEFVVKGSILQPSDYAHRKSLMLRYANGEWIPDDGEYDLAFVAGVIAYYVDMPRHTNHIHSWHDLELTKKYLPEYLKQYARGWHTFTDNNLAIDEYLWKEQESHPNFIAGKLAMNKCVEMNHCGNGQVITLTGDYWGNKDKPILYIKSTMKPIEFPKSPICFKCLDNGKVHIIEAMQSYKDTLESDIEYAKEAKYKAEITIYDSDTIIENAEESLEKLIEDLRIITNKKRVYIK